MDITRANKIYREIKSGKTLEETANFFGLSTVEMYGLIEMMGTVFGKKIEVIETDDKELIVVKKPVRKTQKTIKPDMEDCVHTKFMLVSDTHLGNNRQQLHLLNQLYEEAYQNEISTVYHCGDLVDGDYSSIRKEQPRQVFLHGFDEQAGYVVDMYPRVTGIDTHFILGSHDETHYKNGQATLGYWIPKCRSDMHYLGQDQVSVSVDGILMTMDHPGDGSAYSISYKPQKRIEELETGNKPKILVIGHYHKFYSSVYRNVRAIQVPCTCDKTPFQTKKGISNVMGGVFIDVWSDENHNIQYFSCKERLFNHTDVWDESGKDANKVKQLIR